MKYLALIPFVLLASCASRPQPQIGVGPTPPPAIESVEAVRYADVLRAYHVGRYVDPNHPQTMHEQHPVYRVEASAHWNLHPGALTTASLLNPPPDAAFVPPPTNDAIFAEMNRQRDITERVMAEALKLARSYDELRQIISEMKSVASSNALMGVRVANAEQRIAETEKELRRLALPPQTLSTNEAPIAPTTGP